MMVARLTYEMWQERTGNMMAPEAIENKFPGLFRMKDVDDAEPKWLRKTTRTEEAFSSGTDGWKSFLRVDLSGPRYFIVKNCKR